MQASENTIEAEEIKKFDKMASEWWDPNGKFKPLHMLNPCRLDYIISQICVEFSLNNQELLPFKDLKILDIGCGGGLLCEPMARLGANVVGVDASAKNIPVAQTHARQSGLKIEYRIGSAEALVDEGVFFDVILNMEVIEHVTDPSLFLTACSKLLKPGGVMICSTISRNSKSYLLAILGAEYIMKWLPRGTHDWNKFIPPKELYELLKNADLQPVDKKGFVFNPLVWKWHISNHDLSVNYVTTSIKN